MPTALNSPLILYFVFGYFPILFLNMEIVTYVPNPSLKKSQGLKSPLTFPNRDFLKCGAWMNYFNQNPSFITTYCDLI